MTVVFDEHDMTGHEYSKLKPKVKEQWLAALRSGDYLQAEGYLKVLAKGKKKIHHCCLGVLCEIGPVGNDWKLHERYDTKEARDYEYRELWALDSLTGSLPTAFLNKINLDAQAESDLISMNDRGKSFKYIAAWIERYL